MRANERTDERVAQYLRLDSCLFQTIVHYLRRCHLPSLLVHGSTESLEGFTHLESGGVENVVEEGVIGNLHVGVILVQTTLHSGLKQPRVET